MADTAVITFRPIYLEDLATVNAAAGTQVTDTVMNVGSMLMTPLVLAFGDAGAAALGLRIGDVYLDSSIVPNRLRVRLS